MAVGPKHENFNRHYDPDEDLTLDQIHRFTKVANKIEHKKEEQELEKVIEKEVEEAFEEREKIREEKKLEAAEPERFQARKRQLRARMKMKIRARKGIHYFYVLFSFLILFATVGLLFS